MPDAILDKILTQKHVEEIHSFDPIAVAESLLATLTNRERDIMGRRFGLSPNTEPVTLEAIGSVLKVTRERVRQVTKGAVEKLRSQHQEHEDTVRFARIAEQLLRSYGGVLEEHFFISQVVALADFPATATIVRQRAALHAEFLFKQVLSDLIEYRAASERLRSSYFLVGTERELLLQTAKLFTELVATAGVPLASDDLLVRFRATNFFKEHQAQLLDEPLRNALELYGVSGMGTLSAQAPSAADLLLSYARLTWAIEQNIFGEWGSSNWPTVHPKRMNDKIYLILRQEKKPLHFTAITEKINAAHFDHKVARPASVHNELILDRRFVLVGRGMYALKEWGFERGTVAEVVAGGLRRNPGLNREQIVEEVLRRRFVKKQTVYLALMNRLLFSRRHDGGYEIASPN